MIILATHRIRPHELFLLAVSVLLGVSYLAHVPAPQSLAAAAPRWAVLAWALGLTVSGVVGLTGCLWRGDVTVGLGLERGALLMSTGSLALIAGVVLEANGQRALFSVATTAAWALANIHRCLQITSDLRVIDAAHEGEDDG